MFKILGDTGEHLVVELDGDEVTVPAGVSVAAALLYLDRIPTRHSVVNGLPRAPYCMMGVCFECLIEVNGVVDQRACQIQVHAGMRLRRQLTTTAESHL